ncbi:energy transducer TonB [Nitrincola alkalisediminis]|uniref:energy transducer TonB n=1 Tax=Nitrincola alkalisediminis TaxID=1366656 RepID=UPI001874B5B4|nr:energy transducer TonB [Nitrincola alkalisediminis]
MFKQAFKSLHERSWIDSTLVALLLHALLAYAWNTHRKSTQETALQPGIAGVTVSLASASDLLDAMEAASQQTTYEETPDDASDEPHEPLDEVPEEVVDETIDEAVEVPVEAEPEPRPAPKPVPTEQPQPEPKKVAPTPSTKVMDTTADIQGQSEQITDTPAEQSSTAGANTQGQEQIVDTGGDPAAEVNYYAQLSRYLAQHKRYPMAARRQRREGVAEVKFTINRQGQVLNARIVRSSGHAMLDQEVLEMLTRAAPMPSFPPSINQNQLVITLPVSFGLR